MSGQIEVLPQPRIDTYVDDPVTAKRMLRSEYVGIAWFGGRPQAMGNMIISRGGIAKIETPFWLPDSRGYTTDAPATATVQASAALLSMVDSAQLTDVRAALVANPQDPETLLACVLITGSARVPLGVSYRVTVFCHAPAVRGA